MLGLLTTNGPHCSPHHSPLDSPHYSPHQSPHQSPSSSASLVERARKLFDHIADKEVQDREEEQLSILQKNIKEMRLLIEEIKAKQTETRQMIDKYRNQDYNLEEVYKRARKWRHVRYDYSKSSYSSLDESVQSADKSVLDELKEAEALDDENEEDEVEDNVEEEGNTVNNTQGDGEDTAVSATAENTTAVSATAENTTAVSATAENATTENATAAETATANESAAETTNN